MIIYTLILPWFPRCHSRNLEQYGKMHHTNPLGTCLTLIPAWMNNYIHYKVLDEITYPFPNFNGCKIHTKTFTDDILNFISVNENIDVSIQISLKVLPNGPMNNKSALVLIIIGIKDRLVYWRVSVTRPQWVKMTFRETIDSSGMCGLTRPLMAKTFYMEFMTKNVISWIDAACEMSGYLRPREIVIDRDNRSILDCFWGARLLALSVIMCSFYLFLDRVLFLHDGCDYYWDFYGNSIHFDL